MEPKRGGSLKPIDYDLVRKLALLNPSNDELAYALGISRATLYRRLDDDEHVMSSPCGSSPAKPCTAKLLVTPDPEVRTLYLVV